MKRRPLIIGLAALFAMLGTGAMYVYVKQADARALAGTKAADVLIVQKAIPAGTSVKNVLSGAYLRADHVPATSVPADAISAMSGAMAALVATADLQPGQIVLRQSFGELVPTTSGLEIPSGMLALSFSVSTPGDVGGYVQPNSQIAIFDTYAPISKAGTNSTTGDANKVTRLLLPRVQVLAVSAAAPKSTNKAAGNGTLMVTVALNQADAQRLIHEFESGSLYLALLTQTSRTGPAPGVDSLGLVGPIFPSTAAMTP